MRARLLILLLLSIMLACGYGIYTGRIVIPDERNPWAPLKIEQPLGWLTRMKLDRLSSDPALCRAVLDGADMRYQPLPDRETAPGCVFDNVVRIDETRFDVGRSFPLTCRSAAALALWEYHIVGPAAQTHLSEPVVRLEHFGSYACRNVYGRKDAPLSRHATADALDVAGFVLASGRRISIERDWNGTARDAAFLRELHAGACRVFDGVLGPEYNAAHRDHFHLDRGGHRMCR